MGKKLCWICWVLLTLALVFIGYVFVQLRNPPGRVSPMDMVELPVEGGQLSLIYSRPSMRGRTIFGDLVPYGEVWRTGANEATSFTTDVELELSGTRIPAGSYTLFTLPEEGSMILIINRQTGQWGTVYDPGQDLARVGMMVTTLSEPVERLTLALDPYRPPVRKRLAVEVTADEEEEGVAEDSPDEEPPTTAGTFSIEWETTRATVSFQVIG